MILNHLQKGIKKFVTVVAVSTILITQSSCNEACKVAALLANLCFGLALPAFWWLPVGPGVVVDPACRALVDGLNHTAALNASPADVAALVLDGAPSEDDLETAAGLTAVNRADGKSCDGPCDPEKCCVGLKDARNKCRGLPGGVNPVHGLSPKEACEKDLGHLIQEHCD